MQTLRTIAEVRAVQRSLTGDVGLVPTMGALHEGHLTLVRSARADNDHVFVSIFVNPTQFGPNEDFAAYPRDIDRDLSLLEAEGVDYVFLPSVEEMYPRDAETYVDVGPISDRLEGAFRPGHFRGVATVVLKLFTIVKPARAYFGRKDAQQLVVIRRMVRDLNVDVEIVPVDTVREPDGLAMSSRNAYLNPTERKAALCLHEALSLAREMWTRGARDAEAFRKRLRELIEDEELARIDYVSVADPDTLEELDRIHGPALVSLAVRIGRTRLIDNITLG
ncbi:MAG TPA: pantoate--beta-alanine ligase [Dehalococcoidia bacterium]|nr:pantoate--beta-alanine ligase [Dehalococcoidia bacterium]